MDAAVLAVHSGALGDVILFARFVASLARPIVLLTGGEKGELLRELGAADDALDFDALPMAECYCETPPGRLAAMLPRAETLVSCFAADEEQALQRLADACGARRAVGLAVRPGDDWPGHLTELWAEAMGVAIQPDELATWTLSPALTQAGRDEAERAGLDPAGPITLLHPGAGSREKCWPVERWCELADALGRDRQVAAVLGPVEQETWPRETIEQLRAHAGLVIGADLAALAGLIGEAEVFIGNDSGPAHLAAALNIPAVVLFGPTSATHFTPPGQAVRVITAREDKPIETADINSVMGKLP
jgi:hypothetical protein